VKFRHFAIAITLAACAKKGRPPDPDLEIARTAAGDAIAMLEREVAAAKAKAPNRDPALGFATCTNTIGTVSRLRTGPDGPLADRIEQLCNHDLPIAELEADLAEVEAGTGATACNTFTVAREALARAAVVDPAVGKLVARYDARCVHR
jgi:hypothetical protein